MNYVPDISKDRGSLLQKAIWKDYPNLHEQSDEELWWSTEKLDEFLIRHLNPPEEIKNNSLIWQKFRNEAIQDMRLANTRNQPDHIWIDGKSVKGRYHLIVGAPKGAEIADERVKYNNRANASALRAERNGASEGEVAMLKSGDITDETIAEIMKYGEEEAKKAVARRITDFMNLEREKIRLEAQVKQLQANDEEKERLRMENERYKKYIEKQVEEGSKQLTKSDNTDDDAE
jgi:hypothetical protein